MLLIALLACDPVGEDSDPQDTASAEVTDYAVTWSTDPTPLQAGTEGRFEYAVRDQLGRPIEDLQVTHERIVHVAFISADLESFQHLHHEDFEALSAENLRSSSFSFPVTVPTAGDYRLLFDYAHRNEYLSTTDWLTASGEPQQGEADLTPTESVTANGVTGTVRWDAPALAGYEAQWTLVLEDAAGPVTDLGTYLGADGHALLASADLNWSAHTHAWFPGIDAMGPGHEMPHVYYGPELEERKLERSCRRYTRHCSPARRADASPSALNHPRIPSRAPRRSRLRGPLSAAPPSGPARGYPLRPPVRGRATSLRRRPRTQQQAASSASVLRAHAPCRRLSA